MNLLLIGVNHKTAPIDIREKFFLNETQQELLISELKNDPRVVEGFVISTCNRTELCLNLIDHTLDTATFIKYITNIKKTTYRDTFRKFFYTYKDDQAIQHLLRVTTGLDSLIIGEKQILGQVKSAFERSQKLGLFSKHFNILSNIVIRAGKKAQSETNISYGGSSISWAAIKKAEKDLGELKNKSVLVIGAGKMSELAVGHINTCGFKKLYIMNRTQKNADKIAKQYNAEVVLFCDIKEILSEVDLCICSVGAPHYIIDAETIERVMQKRAENILMFVDISMPRNIDPKVKNIKNVKLYTIDDLDDIVEKNMIIRKNAVIDVEKIIFSKLSELNSKLKKLEHYQNPEFYQISNNSEGSF